MCNVGRCDGEGRERSEKVSGGGVGKVVGGESIIDPGHSIFHFPISQVVLAHFAFVALLANLLQIGNFPI